MSWLFSQALVAEYSEVTCSDGEPFAQLNVMPTQHKFWRNDKMMEFSRLSQFGLTLRLLTEKHGEELLTSYLADFHAKTYHPQEKAQELTANDQECGEKWRESSVRYDLDSSSWKIHLSLFPEDLPWSSVTLPRWGMMRNGFVYQHPTAERPIRGTGSGYSLPTPTCSQAPNKGANTNGAKSLLEVARGHWDHMWPTPRSCSAMAATITPESAWKENRFPNLETVVGRRAWPTPVASMSKGSSPGSLKRKSGADRSNDRLDHAVMAQHNGQLNPMWVEWLMGRPLGWTDLKPLAMDKFREWQQQHSGY